MIQFLLQVDQYKYVASSAGQFGHGFSHDCALRFGCFFGLHDVAGQAGRGKQIARLNWAVAGVGKNVNPSAEGNSLVAIGNAAFLTQLQTRIDAVGAADDARNFMIISGRGNDQLAGLGGVDRNQKARHNGFFFVDRANQEFFRQVSATSDFQFLENTAAIGAESGWRAEAADTDPALIVMNGHGSAASITLEYQIASLVYYRQKGVVVGVAQAKTTQHIQCCAWAVVAYAQKASSGIEVSVFTIHPDAGRNGADAIAPEEIDPFGSAGIGFPEETEHGIATVVGWLQAVVGVYVVSASQVLAEMAPVVLARGEAQHRGA